MLRTDRVKQAIAHKSTDIVPHNVELTSTELRKVVDYLGIQQHSFDEYACNHIEKISYNIGGSYIKTGFFQDEFGVVWNRTGRDKDIGIIEQILLREASLAGFKFSIPDIEQIRKETEEALNNGRDTFKFGKIGTAYFERAWSLRGMENLLMDFHTNPTFVEELLENILAYNLKIIETAVSFGIDGFYFGDDYGQQTGMLMSPDMWRKFIMPGLEKMFEKVKDAGKVVALHCCGNIEAILGDLIDIGLNIYQTVQPEVYNLKKLKAEYGDKITFWGAISTQQTLPFVSPSELKDIVQETIDVMNHTGGYIAAPTHRIPEDVPAENVAALIALFKHQ